VLRADYHAPKTKGRGLLTKSRRTRGRPHHSIHLDRIAHGKTSRVSRKKEVSLIKSSSHQTSSRRKKKNIADSSRRRSHSWGRTNPAPAPAGRLEKPSHQ